MDVYNRAKSEIKVLERTLEEKRSEYRGMPNGRLECHKRNGGWRWLLVKDKKQKYLSHKSELVLARKMAYKRLLKCEIEMTSAKLDALKHYVELANPEKILSAMDKRARDNLEINRLALEHKNKNNLKLQDWMDSVRSTEPFRTEELTIQSKSGHKVRSKSEAIIDGALFEHGLSYVYEPKLSLTEPFVDSYARTERPDFGIWSRKTGGPIYWEHFGLLDNSDYLRSATEKLKIYMFNGIIPMKNLIITSESKGRDLDAEGIEAIIEYYFD